MLYIIFEPSTEVKKIVCQQELIYLACEQEIIVLSLRRMLNRKDIIKKKIQIPTFSTSDKFTKAFNDNQQMNFITLSYNDQRYPLLYSSNLEQRLNTLNSEQPQIKDFFIYNQSVLVLFNNGTLVLNDKLIREHVIAIAVYENSVCIYYDDIINIDDQEYVLNNKYKDEIIYQYGYVCLQNQDEILIIRNGQIQIIPQGGVLQIAFLDDYTLLLLKQEGIINFDLNTQQSNIIRTLNSLSKFYLINENQSLLFKNGDLINKGEIIKKFQKIVSVCHSQNQILEFVCQQDLTTQKIKCLILEKSSFLILNKFLYFLIENRFQKPLDMCDLKIYLHYYPTQYSELLQETRYLSDKDKKQNHDFYKLYSKNDILQAANILLLNLLMIKYTDKSRYQDSYLFIYKKYLNSIINKTDRIKEFLEILEHNKNITSYIDKCPICQDDLVSHTACQKHRFMRCSTTLIPINEQQITCCKICKLKTIEKLNVCPICYGQMKTLL